jgi:hypothetical protein
VLYLFSGSSYFCEHKPIDMGILLMFLLFCMLLYALLVTHGVYYLLQLVLLQWMGLDLSTKALWIIVNLVLWALSFRFFYFLLEDSKGGTPNVEGVWKFYLVLDTLLFLIVFLYGYKSK